MRLHARVILTYERIERGRMVQIGEQLTATLTDPVFPAGHLSVIERSGR